MPQGLLPLEGAQTSSPSLRRVGAAPSIAHPGQSSVSCFMTLEQVPGLPALSPQRMPQHCPAGGSPCVTLAMLLPVPSGSVASTVHSGMLTLFSISTSMALTSSISSSRLRAMGDCMGPPPRRPPSPVCSGAVPPLCTEKSWQRW